MNDTTPKIEKPDLPPHEPGPAEGNRAAEEKKAAGTPAASTPPGKAPTQPAKRQSRMRNFMRSLLRWAIFALIFFLAGGIVLYIALYQPAQEAASQTQVELEQARQQIVELEQRVDSLQSLEDTNEVLAEENREARVHLAILSALADTLEARLALAQDSPAEADLALSRTSNTLNSLKSLLPQSQQQNVTDMQSRLSLALAEIEENDFAAESDLDVLTTQLMQLENALFTNP